MKFNNHMKFGSVLLFVVVVVVGLYLYNRMGNIQNDGHVRPGRQNISKDEVFAPVKDHMSNAMSDPSAPLNGPAPIQKGLQGMDSAAQQLQEASCYPKDQLLPEELLPKDNSSVWAQAMGEKGPLSGKNFLNAGFLTGINTVGSTMRNANLQLRSEPPNPQIQNLTPWNNTTIMPDMGRKPFEIGGCS